jgi:hypothetical protein
MKFLADKDATFGIHGGENENIRLMIYLGIITVIIPSKSLCSNKTRLLLVFFNGLHSFITVLLNLFFLRHTRTR